MNSSTIKWIAIITMMIDHIGAVLFGGTQYEIYFRIVGRLAFPLFAFMIVEGFYHTSSVHKYLRRLGIFALVSEIPFDLAFNYQGNGNFKYSQNIFFTLFFGLFTIYLMKIVANRMKDKKVLSILTQTWIVIVSCIVATLLMTDYVLFGILMIVIFYTCRENKMTKGIFIILINFIMGVPQVLAALSLIFIWNYNGEKGKPLNKYVFYCFYPVHLLILAGIKYWLL